MFRLKFDKFESIFNLKMVNVFQDKTAKPSNYNKLTRNKLAIGDIFELQTEKGVAFLQCVEIPTDNSNCELIKVFYQLHTESQDLDEVVRGDFFFNISFFKIWLFEFNAKN